jgi:non-haem dioxygenase in morphine synthesis N-terminal
MYLVLLFRANRAPGSWPKKVVNPHAFILASSSSLNISSSLARTINMSTTDVKLPLVDLKGYLAGTPEEKEKVIAEVRDACTQYGFFQVKGHGVPLRAQKGLLQSINTFFNLPKEEKLKLSFMENPSRRGYEASGMSLRDGDALPDSKEVGFFRHSLVIPIWRKSIAKDKTRPST